MGVVNVLPVDMIHEQEGAYAWIVTLTRRGGTHGQGSSFLPEHRERKTGYLPVRERRQAIVHLANRLRGYTKMPPETDQKFPPSRLFSCSRNYSLKCSFPGTTSTTTHLGTRFFLSACTLSLREGSKMACVLRKSVRLSVSTGSGQAPLRAGWSYDIIPKGGSYR
jgi:hypothetical protein